MASHKYDPGTVIWRWGNAYPATSHNRNIPREAFPGSPSWERSERRKQQEVNQAISKVMNVVMALLVFAFTGLIAATICIFAITLFIGEFTIKIVYKTIHSKLKKEKIKSDNFKKNQFENACMMAIIASKKIFEKGHQLLKSDINKIDSGYY